MPNRCSNYVEIQAKPEVIAKIKETITKDWRFVNFYPIPKELLLFSVPARAEFWEDDALFKQRKIRLEKLYWTTSWYDRAVKNWWTKWDVDPSITNESETNLSVIFESARSMPNWAMAKLTEVFDCEITLHEFSEPWCCFSGRYSYEKWETSENENYNDPYFWEGKKCTECGYEYDPECEDDRYDDACTICYSCWEDLDSNQNE